MRGRGQAAAPEIPRGGGQATDGVWVSPDQGTPSGIDTAPQPLGPGPHGEGEVAARLFGEEPGCRSWQRRRARPRMGEVLDSGVIDVGLAPSARGAA